MLRTKSKRGRDKLNRVSSKPAQRRSYTGVLGEIRRKASPEVTGTDIKMVRRTRFGDILLELGQNMKDKVGFSSKLKKILSEKTNINSL